MPKAGVGRKFEWNYYKSDRQFQSIYAQSRRWKFFNNLFFNHLIIVSIHLCPKQALEVQLVTWERLGQFVSIHLCPKQALEDGMFYGRHCKKLSFNPFMPKAGVGRSVSKSYHNTSGFVSIHLCPKQALEDVVLYIFTLSTRCFNPFMPKAGVGSLWLCWSYIHNYQVSIHLCPKQALEG